MTKEELIHELKRGKTIKELLSLSRDDDSLFYRADNLKRNNEIAYIPDLELLGIPVNTPPQFTEEEFDSLENAFFTGQYFYDICDGDDSQAEAVFFSCSWQHPCMAKEEYMEVTA